MQYPRLAAKLPKKRAFITGAGGGLGLSFARALAGDGWTIGLADLDRVNLSAAEAKIKSCGVSASAFCFDVADYDAYTAAAAEFLRLYGGVDLLINNAGIGCGGLLEDISVDNWQRVLDINVLGSVYGCKLFLPVMKRDNCGHILNLASAAAVVAPPCSSPYNISKAAMVTLSESLHNELLGSDITVSVFMPSFIRTGIGKSTIGDPAVQKRAEVAVSESKLSADWAVDRALSATESGEFYIVLPREIRFLWLFKRLFPKPFLTFIADWTDKRSKQLDQKAL